MKKILNAILLFLLVVPVATAQTDGRNKTFVVGFYNLENLFDI